MPLPQFKGITRGNALGRIFNSKTLDGQTDRLTFKRFKGSDIIRAIEGGGEPKPATTVVLKINPQEIGHAKPKITQKVQTSAPGRFVVFDWGTDLLVMTISGNTGNLLPDMAQSGVIGSLDNLAADISQDFGAGLSSVIPNVARIEEQITTNVLMGQLTYSELISMSPKYRAFMRLQDLYDIFDADRDVLTLEIGDDILRGYFLDFSFTQTAESPWNWKYSITLSSLQNLTKLARRGDEEYPRDSSYLVF